MRIRAAVLVAAGVAVPHTATAQQSIPSELALTEALEIARANNPTYLQARNDGDLAAWDVRQAYAQLYLPSANLNSSLGWRGTGDQQFGSITLGDLGFGQQPSIYSSSYNIGLSYNLNLSTILEPRRAKAQRGATEAQIRLAEAQLVARVTGAYLEVLRQREVVRLAEQQLENSRFNLRLAQGQLEVGQATPIDVGQAEVQVGRAQVVVLQAENALQTARMRLLQEMGVPVEQDVTLTTSFELSEPEWDQEELFRHALEMNPTLDAARRSRRAADIGVAQARSAYLPSLSLSTGWSGFTREASSVDGDIARAQASVAASVQQCVATNELYQRLADPLPALDCSRYRFTDDQRQAILDANDQFPFNFTRSPPSVSLGISIPIFQGLSRQRNLEAARAQREDLTHQLREQEIGLRADLAVGLANARTAFQSALLEQRNRDLAEQQLRLARERYQLGAITFVELVDAQTVLAQAERDLAGAIFAYHDTVSNLETIVGTSLRN